MTLETLKIEFQAETSAVEERLSALGARLDGFSGTLSATVNSARTAGSASALGFAQSVDSGAALARQSAANVVASANFSDAAALRRARSAGGALASGFAAGISAKSGSVYSAVRRMVNQATQLIRSQLGIHSPSRVAAGFGGSFGEGQPHRRMRAALEEINLEGACHGHGQCAGCDGDCGACASTENN